MRYRKNIGRRLAVTVLATVLACGNVPMQVAWGLESVQLEGATAQVSDVQVQSEDAEGEQGVVVDEPAEGDAVAGDAATTDAAPQADATGADAQQPAAATNDDTTGSADPAPAAENQPYSIEVTFGGQALNEGEGNNNLTDVWTSGSKRLNVKLTRNKSVAVKPGKQYVLCMSVPDMLYFSGVPEAGKITGVENVAMIQNAVPTFNTTLNNTTKYPLSSYSGQMRLLLNTAADMVTIADLDVLFDPQLLGYSTTDNTTISDALNIRVVEVDDSEQLDKFSDDAATKLVSRKIDSLQIKNGTAPTTDRGLRMRLSTDGFNQQSATGGTLKLGRSGNITYVLEAAQKSTQAYKKLTVVLSCPYILVDTDDDGTAEKYYLSFDPNSSVLDTNRLTSNAAGFKMTGPAVYDANAHTITYTFENLYIAAWQMIAVTPQFYWPSDLDDTVAIPENGYQVYFEDSASGRKAWTITEEQTYCETNTELLPTSHNGSGSATFINDGVNLTLKSSAEDVEASGNKPESSKLGKRVIYEGVTRENGVSGGLGYFDLHNEGVTAAPTSKITFEFNTDESDGATYYVNRVNIPLDGNTGGTDIHYILVNGAGDKIEGTKHVNNTSSFQLNASLLMSGAGTGEGYYIKSISYTTTLLRAGAQYHSEVTHGKRNFIVDYGLYFGYIEGSVGSTAHAKMTIESPDGSALNTAGDTKLEATETTWVGDDDSVYLEMTNTASNRGVSLDGASSTSQSITAGGTTTLSFRPSMTNAEDQTVETSASGGITYTGILNGYHTVRNPIVYVCLPKGVSIAGPDQATALISGSTTKATSVKQLIDCTYEGVDATWWEVRFDGASMKMASARFDFKLSTSSIMAGVTWNFEKAIAFRAGGQALKGTSTTTGCSQFINNIARFRTLTGNNAMLEALATALEGDPDANGKLGLFYYTYSVATTLNIARAEAKLDVDTELSVGKDVRRDLKVTDASTEVDYEVIVKSTDGGSAENFNYYIPVAKQSATIDANGFVAQSDYDLQLKKAVQITDLSGSNAATPFEVLYTTKEGLDSTSVAELQEATTEEAGASLDPSTGWVKEEDFDGNNYGAVTAILIRTKQRASVADGSQYQFNVTLGYDNSVGDFASQAGRSVVWRSFGHYVYKRNDEPTENTYPSQENSVKLGYVANYTNDPIDVTLDTSMPAKDLASIGRNLGQTFKNNQTVAIKNVIVSDGTTLTGDDPSDLTGSDANSTFRMALSLDNSTFQVLKKGYSGEGYFISANTPVSLTGGVRFSRALTDTTTERYVDVVLGNDDIDVTVRIKLNRTVKAASVAGSGTAPGENFQAVNVTTDAEKIAANGSFTALFDVEDFVPGNYSAQKLMWKRGGTSTPLPAGTTVTMLALNDSDAVDSMWLWRADGLSSSVDLSQFKRMAGNGPFSYDTTSATATRLKYQFVVSFPAGNAVAGDYKLAFEATPVSGGNALNSELPVTLLDRSSFSLSVDDGNVSYAYTKSGGDDVRTTGKQLALVLTPKTGAVLPADARISAGGKEYAKNAAGKFIVPLGTVASGTASLSLVSSMMGAAGGSFAFDASLMLYTGEAGSPMAGTEVADADVTLSVAAQATASIKVTGTRVAHKSEWASGEDFDFEATKPTDATVTVSAYNGLSLSTPATNLLSSVGGVFDVNGGTGTYKGGTQTGKLVLSGAADAGTYRLVFDVTAADDTKLASTTYYVIVRD